MAVPRKKAPFERLVIQMPPGSRERLDKLKTQVEATTRSMVIRRAIDVLEVLMKEQKRGGKIQVHSPDGTVTWMRLL